MSKCENRPQHDACFEDWCDDRCDTCDPWNDPWRDFWCDPCCENRHRCQEYCC